MAISEYIEGTETILAETGTRLEAEAGWHVWQFSGTSLEDLLDELSTALLPAAVVVYRGADRGTHPRRTVLVTVMVVALAADREAGAVAAREWLDRSFELLDGHVFNQAVWEYRGDRAVDVGNGLAAYAVEFSVRLD